MKKFILAIALASVASIAFADGHRGVSGEWPQGGGPITVSFEETIESGGLDFKSAGGYLSNTDSAAPYQFFVSQKPEQVTFGNLGTKVTHAADSSLTLGVSVSGEAGADDVTATWGDGVTPVAFPVTVVPEPATGLMAAFGLIGLLGLRRRR